MPKKAKPKKKRQKPEEKQPEPMVFDDKPETEELPNKREPLSQKKRPKEKTTKKSPEDKPEEAEVPKEPDAPEKIEKKPEKPTPKVKVRKEAPAVEPRKPNEELHEGETTSESTEPVETEDSIIDIHPESEASLESELKELRKPAKKRRTVKKEVKVIVKKGERMPEPQKLRETRKEDEPTEESTEGLATEDDFSDTVDVDAILEPDLEEPKKLAQKRQVVSVVRKEKKTKILKRKPAPMPKNAEEEEETPVESTMADTTETEEEPTKTLVSRKQVERKRQEVAREESPNLKSSSSEPFAPSEEPEDSAVEITTTATPSEDDSAEQPVAEKQAEAPFKKQVSKTVTKTRVQRRRRLADKEEEYLSESTPVGTEAEDEEAPTGIHKGGRRRQQKFERSESTTSMESSIGTLNDQEEEEEVPKKADVVEPTQKVQREETMQKKVTKKKQSTSNEKNREEPRKITPEEEISDEVLDTQRPEINEQAGPRRRDSPPKIAQEAGERKLKKKIVSHKKSPNKEKSPEPEKDMAVAGEPPVQKGDLPAGTEGAEAKKKKEIRQVVQKKEMGKRRDEESSPEFATSERETDVPRASTHVETDHKFSQPENRLPNSPKGTPETAAESLPSEIDAQPSESEPTEHLPVVKKQVRKQSTKKSKFKESSLEAAPAKKTTLPEKDKAKAPRKEKEKKPTEPATKKQSSPIVEEPTVVSGPSPPPPPVDENPAVPVWEESVTVEELPDEGEEDQSPHMEERKSKTKQKRKKQAKKIEKEETKVESDEDEEVGEEEQEVEDEFDEGESSSTDLEVRGRWASSSESPADEDRTAESVESLPREDQEEEEAISLPVPERKERRQRRGSALIPDEEKELKPMSLMMIEVKGPSKSPPGVLVQDTDKEISSLGTFFAEKGRGSDCVSFQCRENIIDLLHVLHGTIISPRSA